MHDFEKLGAFYLGKGYDIERGQLQDDLLLYDAKDLTTHAVCVGMTGSGKTGLCLSLLEEAAIDGIPSIVIDPKGDLGNLLLTFPELKGDDFRPWIDESAALREGVTPEQHAEQTAKRWREGLAAWGQTPERIARFRDAVDISIYTPGSNAGLPLSVVRNFNVPSPAVMEDSDAYRDQLTAAAGGLLALLGIDPDPIRSREHILLANVLDHAWRAGRDLDLPKLIHEIQAPPFETVGVLDLDTFYPAKDRLALAMNLNNLLASPSFAGWMEGDPINAQRLLYTADGRPRISIISIAHLSESERMFLVTILLNEVVSWVRSQPGTSSLRALLYMDEIFGYFPPTANPPSKKPMLTLLKQARAYGLGIVLATQNPVDLDYKGLSNTGTWFLGRLQTERDKARVLDGLESVSTTAGARFDRRKLEAMLSSLDKRVFLMNNVHEDEPVVFHTRWALSYLRGPLTRSQIKSLMDPLRPPPAAEESTEEAKAAPEEHEAVAGAILPEASVERPLLSPEIDETFLAAEQQSTVGQLVYRPALVGIARLHFVRVTYDVDTWQECALLQPLRNGIPDVVWKDAEEIVPGSAEFRSAPREDGEFSELDIEATKDRNYPRWEKKLKDYLYRTRTRTVWKCKAVKLFSTADESEGEFRVRVAQAAREKRDLEVEKLRKRYAKKFATQKNRIERADKAVAREKSQSKSALTQSAISFGSSILGALLGRKLTSRTNVSKAATSMRSASRAAEAHGDIGVAQQKLAEEREKLAALEKGFEEDAAATESKYDPAGLTLERLDIRPRKSDIGVQRVALVWMPWLVDTHGAAEPAYLLDSVEPVS